MFQIAKNVCDTVIENCANSPKYITLGHWLSQVNAFEI